MRYNVKGYHGTVASSATDIISNGFEYRTYDINDYKGKRLPNDLGFGIYFYLDNPKISKKALDNAKDYAIKYKKKLNTDSVSVIVADISICEDSHLDLDEADNLEYYLGIQNTNQQRAEEIWAKSKQDGQRKRKMLDGIFIEMMILDLEEAIGRSIKTVQKETFTSFGRAQRSNFFNGTELTVRDANILKVERTINYG
ncbi:hypothetical protein [Salinicoccus roseus]|uniref:hypothetical protein n=1 Tax=Salinicoccus roseus TaxID=45670 RepID=UPI000F515D52|nr:hypothetical protein [Salinicoccus roseus]GGA72488.1 hypothetical protein GCM10007176_15800 [Salinicoccus roseus]